jgi:Na+/melibiose symporter-like transporter
MILQMFFKYDTKLPAAPDAIAGYRVCSGIAVGTMFAICTVLLFAYQLNKRITIQMAEELAQRRKKFAPESQLAAAS